MKLRTKNTLLRALLAALTAELIGCAATKEQRAHPKPDPLEETFVRFLQEDGRVTRSQIQRYLASNDIAHSVSQDTWGGIDRWKIADWGLWTARYYGRKNERKGEAYIIPADIDWLLNQPQSSSAEEALKNSSKHYYYDSIRQHSRNREIRFDRANNAAHTTRGVAAP